MRQIKRLSFHVSQWKLHLHWCTEVLITFLLNRLMNTENKHEFFLSSFCTDRQENVGWCAVLVGLCIVCVFVCVFLCVQGQQRGHQCLVCVFLQSGDSRFLFTVQRCIARALPQQGRKIPTYTCMYSACTPMCPV